MDEDGFDFMKISFLRDIKAQNRSLRFVSSLLRTVIFQNSPAYKYYLQRLFEDLCSFEVL